MNKTQVEAIELTEFVKNFIPSGWKESIGTVCHVHHFSWFEIEAIKEWVKRPPNQGMNEESKMTHSDEIIDALKETLSDKG